MKIRGRITYSKVAATTAVVVALAGSGGAAFALGKNTVGSPQIKNESIQSKDIKNGQVSTKDVKNGTVGNADLASGVDGLAVAGIKVGSTPTVDEWFNRNGGKPVVTKLDTGLYQIDIPGVAAESTIINVTSQSGPTDCQSGTFEGEFLVDCYNAAGNSTDASFHITVY